MKAIAFLVVLVTMIFTLFVLGALFALPTMWLVNVLFTKATILSLFGTAKIGFWQAFGLNVLTGFLFRSTSKT